MPRDYSLNHVKMYTAAIIGGFIGSLTVLIFLMISGFGKASGPVIPIMVSSTPGLDILEAHRCPSGQKKIQIIKGIEDGFARGDAEPAIIRPKLLELPFYNSLYTGSNSLLKFRNFDEMGADKVLFSYVEFPEKIASGKFAIGFQPQGNMSTDAIQFSDYSDRAKVRYSPQEFNVQFTDVMTGKIGQLQGDVAVIDLKDFTGASEILLDYLNRNSGSTTLDIQIHDDARIDFFGLSLCQKPILRKGTTMSVDMRDYVDPGLSVIVCNFDPNQMPCDPLIGDTICSDQVPLGCYQEGARLVPEGLSTFPDNFVGGEVKVTPSVRGDRFESLADATNFCKMSFGDDWRVVSFHEAGGAIIISHSDLTARTRMWVDVKDKPAATCWRNGPNHETANE